MNEATFLFKSEINTDEEHLKQMREGLRNIFFISSCLTSFTVCSGDIKKKAFFFHWSFSELFFRPPALNLKKNPVNQLIKKFWPNWYASQLSCMSMELLWCKIITVFVEYRLR